MYEYEGLQDVIFIALYCVATFAALLACVYLLCRRGNAFMQEKGPESVKTIETPSGPLRLGFGVRSSLRLRRWTAALMAAIVGSHVWWYVLGQVWLTDDRLVRNIIAIALDHVTLVPLTMAVLLAMLQDRRRPLWPWLVAEVSAVVVTAVMGIAGRDEFWGYDVLGYCQLALIAGFIVYYALALRYYGRWLRDNYANLKPRLRRRPLRGLRGLHQQRRRTFARVSLAGCHACHHRLPAVARGDAAGTEGRGVSHQRKPV